MKVTNPQASMSSQSALSRDGSDKTYLRATCSRKSNDSSSGDESFDDIQDTMTAVPQGTQSNLPNKTSSQKLCKKVPSTYSSESENLEDGFKSSRCSIDDMEEVCQTITILDRKLDAASLSLSLKSCEDFTIKPEPLVPQKVKPSFREIENERKTRDDAELEGIIKYLYETIKDTKGPLFENLEWMEKSCCKNEPKENWESVQEYYDSTVSEVADIWRNTICLIGSVKDHTLKFVEEKCDAIDKEQLTLEAEMLQLAVDFAISYSKLKADFLVKGVRKRLGATEHPKSDLENFMDSKTFAALYNDEDLAAMAQTVLDLKTSVLKGEDLEMD